MGLDMYLYMSKYESAHHYDIQNGKKITKQLLSKRIGTTRTRYT